MVAIEMARALGMIILALTVLRIQVKGLYLNNITLMSLSPLPSVQFTSLCPELNASYNYWVIYAMSAGGFDFGPMIINDQSKFGSPAHPYSYDFPLTTDDTVLFNASTIEQDNLPNPLLIASESQEPIMLDLNIWMFCSSISLPSRRVGYNVFLDEIQVSLSKGSDGAHNQSSKKALLELAFSSYTTTCYDNYYGIDCSVYCEPADVRGNCDDKKTVARCSTRLGFLCCDDEYPGEPCTTYEPQFHSTTSQPSDVSSATITAKPAAPTTSTVETVVTTSQSYKSKENLYEIIMIVLGCIAGILLWALLICLICMFCRNRKANKKVAAAKMITDSTQTSFPAAAIGILPSVRQDDRAETIGYFDFEYDPSQESQASTVYMQQTPFNPSLDSRQDVYPRSQRQRPAPPPYPMSSRHRPQTPDEGSENWMIPVRLERSMATGTEHYV